MGPVFALLLIAASPAEHVRALNAAGEKLHAAGQYSAAADKFSAALKLDPKNAAAHYCKGRAVAKILEGDPCNWDYGSHEEALRLLKEAVRLSASYRNPIASGDGMKSIARTTAYLFLIGHTPAKDTQWILQNADWWAFPSNSYAPIPGLKFKANGKVTGGIFLFGRSDVGYDHKPGEMRYSVKGDRVTIKRKGHPDVQARLHRDGRLVFEDGRSLTTLPDRCGV